jgi:hypothetical protein
VECTVNHTVFGGDAQFESGDDYMYYASLLEDRFFEPRTLAKVILEALPTDIAFLDDNHSYGTKEIPSIREYFRAQAHRLPGGTPVLVFDDVNIKLKKHDPTLDEERQMENLRSEMGPAHAFFGYLMSRGYEKGVIIFVSTSSLLVAKYFQTLKNGSKSRTLKNDRADFTCQKFGWSTENLPEVWMQHGKAFRISEASE